MPRLACLALTRFLEGQVQPGNSKHQKTFEVRKTWTTLGGSSGAASFLSELPSASLGSTGCRLRLQGYSGLGSRTDVFVSSSHIVHSPYRHSSAKGVRFGCLVLRVGEAGALRNLQATAIVLCSKSSLSP